MWYMNSLEERLAFMIISLLLIRELQTKVSRKADEAMQNSSVEILCKSFLDRISIELDAVEVIETGKLWLLQFFQLSAFAGLYSLPASLYLHLKYAEKKFGTMRFL